MAHFLSASQRIRADPVLSLSWGHQPCHRYTSWKLSTRNKAVGETREVTTRGQVALPLGHPCRRASLGCGALYRSSCRKGSELTRSGTLDGWENSLATNSPDVLLRWKSRGVKLNFPGSEAQNKKVQLSPHMVPF